MIVDSKWVLLLINPLCKSRHCGQMGLISREKVPHIWLCFSDSVEFHNDPVILLFFSFASICKLFRVPLCE
jgi:hypothetical protein